MNKSKLQGDKLIINSTLYSVDGIPNLSIELAAYKVAEKSYNSHIAFASELSPYSNFHISAFTINNQHFLSSEQLIQHQKALMFRDSFIANKILQTETPIEYKRLSYQINCVDREKWQNDGYEVC